ncbi:hypothetical protein ACIXFO_12695 [Bacteroides fragilis]|nr:MAG TPA: hypothetical protein [Caudoviricetes sp.]
MNNLPEQADTGRHGAVKAACACLFRICHRVGRFSGYLPEIRPFRSG